MVIALKTINMLGTAKFRQNYNAEAPSLSKLWLKPLSFPKNKNAPLTLSSKGALLFF
jgi:hypothetical protein